MYLKKGLLWRCVFAMCKMLRLTFDAPSVMSIEKKHQNHSVHVPGKKENTQQEGYALLKAVLCSPEAVFREQMDFVCTNQQIYQETFEEKSNNKKKLRSAI